MSTKIVNLFHDPYDIYIGRAGKGRDGYFGNPFPLKTNEERGTTIAKYKDYFLKRIETDIHFKNRVLALEGLTLGCFCKQKNKEIPCHGDVIVEYLNNYGKDKK